MKLKLKTPTGPSDAPSIPPPADAPAPLPAPGPAKPGGLKLKLKPSAPASATVEVVDSQNSDVPKAKRKYTKKPKLDEGGNPIPPGKPGPKKRAREDEDDVDSPAAKRKPKPTAKAMANAGESSDDENTIAVDPPPPRPAPTRTQSIKINMKGAKMSAPQRTSSTSLKLKGAGKAPPRPYGEGYDSEAEEAEADPAIESQFILRMLPGEDCDLLRKSIEEKTIGKSAANGGPGVNLRFLDREGRRAMVTIRGRSYAASMVELPAVVESLKSWNKKDWVKTADVCQMLLVLGRVQTDEEAKKYSRPSFVDPDSHRFPHGLTPPMKWARKLRFRPRKSYLDVERAEAQMNRLLAEDESAESTRYELVETDQGSSGEDSSSDEELDNKEEMMNAAHYEEEDPMDLEQMLQAGLMEDEDIDATGDADDMTALFGSSDNTLQVETPTTAHDVAMHALSQNGQITLEPETAASTPAAGTSGDDDDDDDDDDGDSDEEADEVDEAAAAEEQRQEQLRAEIAELQKAIEQNYEKHNSQANFLYKRRMMDTISKQKADLEIKLKQLDGEPDD